MTTQNAERPDPLPTDPAALTEDENRSHPTVGSPDEIEPGPFARHAGAIRRSGIGHPLPLPFGKKTPPPSGFTGASGATPSGADIEEWNAHRGGANVGIRLVPDIVGIDRDDHKHPEAAAATIAALEAAGDPLPPTYRITKRADEDDVSGIHLYRLQEDVDEAELGDPGPGVETIRYGHRYVMGPGSIHPDGGMYEVVAPDGTRSTQLPHHDELPVLNPRHVEALKKKGRPTTRASRQAVATEELAEQLEQYPNLRRHLSAYLPSEDTWREDVGAVATMPIGTRDERGESWEKPAPGLAAKRATRAMQLDATRVALGEEPRYVDIFVEEFDKVGEGALARDKATAHGNIAKAVEWGPALPDNWDARVAAERFGSGGSDASGASGGSNGGGGCRPPSGGSDACGASGGSDEGVIRHRGIELPLDVVEDGELLLDEVRGWLGRHISVNDEHDLDVLTVWAAHTHLSECLHTTPRLQVDSAVPESGKTTTLEHLQRLCFAPLQASSISSPALLARVIQHEPRTLLLDEVDRTLDPKKEGVGELIALLNSGYKVGATRPTLVPVKGGDWEAKEFTTFAPVAMAGNQPALPDDTKSRIIRIVLLPDHLGVVEESDWEMKDEQASELGARLARWAVHLAEDVRPRPEMPQGCTSRLREKWQPLARVAQAAGPRWLATMLECAAQDVARVQHDREAGLAAERPSLLVLRHILQSWPAFSPFWATTDMVEELVREHPDVWGASSDYGKALTPQRLGRMLVSGFDIRSTVEDAADKNSRRGYRKNQFWRVSQALDSRPKVSPDPSHGTAGNSGTTGTAGAKGVTS